MAYNRALDGTASARPKGVAVNRYFIKKALIIVSALLCSAFSQPSYLKASPSNFTAAKPVRMNWRMLAWSSPVGLDNTP